MLCKYSEIAKGHADSACPFLLCVQPPPCLPPRTAGRTALDSGAARRFCSAGTSHSDSGCTRGPAVSRSRSAPYRSLKCRFALVLCRGGCGRRRPILRASIQMRQGSLRGGEIPPQAIQKNTRTKEDPSRHYSSTTSALGRNGSGPSARRGVQRPRRPLAGGYGGEEPLSRESGRLASRNLPGVIFSDCRNAREKLRS